VRVQVAVRQAPPGECRVAVLELEELHEHGRRVRTDVAVKRHAGHPEFGIQFLSAGILFSSTNPRRMVYSACTLSGRGARGGTGHPRGLRLSGACRAQRLSDSTPPHT
jgi:hypothetical protein